ncbi:MAG: terminase small subunit [Bacteroidetes bacterium]|nr:terminase small subunit [Bacteroidota bacterium]
MSTNGLNVRRRRFVEEYAVDWNATQAAKRAGYSLRTAYSQGQRLLKNVEIQKAIEKRLDRLSMTAAEALKRLTDMARGSFFPFVKINEEGRFWLDLADEEAQKHLHLIKKMRVRRRREKGGKGEADWEVEWLEVELYDAMTALDKIARAHGIYRDSLNVNMSAQVQIIDFSADD